MSLKGESLGEPRLSYKKLTAEEQLEKSLLEGTLKTNIRLAPENRIAKNNLVNQP